MPGRSVDIRTSPELLEELGDWLEQRGIAWNVMIEDVGVLMEAEKVVLRSSHFWGSVLARYRLLTYILTGDIKQDNSRCTLDGLDQLPPSGGHLWLVELPDCNSFLAFWSRFDYLEQTFDFCEKELIGQSHEGQDMIVMKVKAHYLGMFPDIKKNFSKHWSRCARVVAETSLLCGLTGQ